MDRHDLPIRGGGDVLGPDEPEPQPSERLELREEDVVLSKRQQEIGAVEMGKEVVSERRLLDVPLGHEELVIEHQPLDPPEPARVPIGGDRILKVVLRREIALIRKEPVVTEEVRAGRRVAHETQHLETTIRREVADAQKEGDVTLHEPPTEEGPVLGN